MARFRLLIPPPARLMRFIALILRKAIELKSLEDPIDAGLADLDIMIAIKIHRNFIGSKMIRLAEIKELG